MGVSLVEPDDVDPDEGAPAAGVVTDLDRLLADVEQYEPEPFRITHPLLEQYTLVFRSDLAFEEIDGWRKKAVIKRGRNGQADEVDAAKASALIIAGSCTGIYLDGQPVTDSKGNTVSFRNAEFQDKLGCNRNAANAARKFLLKDSALGTISNKVVDESGYGDDVEEAPDPTESGR